MLNTNSTSASLSLNISDILLPANWEKQTTDRFVGGRFYPKYFAINWESIYLNSIDMAYGIHDIRKGMRKLVTPTLLITSKQAKMIYVVASNDNPVYIPSEYEKHPDYGYLMAFGLSPYSSPEYIFYCCKYGIWDRLLESRINRYDEVHNWNKVGTAVCDAELGEMRITPEYIVRNLGKIPLPTINEQEQLIAAAQKHDNKILNITSQSFEVSNLIRHYRRETYFLFHDASNLGLMTELYRRAAGKYANLKVLHLLSQYEFQPDILSETEMMFLVENLDKVVNHILLSDDMRKLRAEGFIQPQELTDLMCYLASFPEDVTVYNPFAGANSYGLSLHNPVVGDEINPINWAIGQIRLFANQAEKRVNITLKDSFIELYSDKKYPAIIASPAYLYEEGQEINNIVSKLYGKLEEGGTMACIVTIRFLYTKNKAVTQIRELLIKDHAIKSVIMLPAHIFIGTSTPQAIIILTKDSKNSEIQFGDATTHVRFAKNAYRTTKLDLESFIDAFESDIEIVDIEEVDGDAGCAVPYSNLIDSDLRPFIYLARKSQEGIALSELATTLSETIGVNSKPTYYITNTSIPEAMHFKSFMPCKTVNSQISNNLSCVVIKDNAVILTLVNGKLRTVYTDEFVGKIAFPTGTMKVLHPLNRDNAKYLAALLVSDLVPEQIKAQMNGTIIPNFSQLDLSVITVCDAVTSKEREQIIEKVVSSEIDDMKNDKDLKLDRLKTELRTTRHAMVQTWSAMQTNLEELEWFMKTNEGHLSLSDIIGEINPISVQDMIASIKYSLQKFRCQINSLKLEYMNWGETESIEPYTFINQYIANQPVTHFKMINVGNKNCTLYYDEESDSSNIGKILVSILFRAPVQKIRRIFDNIVANAVAHGFTDSNRKDYCLLFDWKRNDKGIVITIANNGTPLLNSVTGDMILSRGFTTASNSNDIHTGLGGFEIKELMEDIGSVEIKSQSDNEFTVVYELTFTDIIIENTNFF